MHRCIREHWIYKEKRIFSKYEAWLDLLMDANHKGNKFVLGNEIFECERGQIITSIRQLCDKWNWSNTKVTKFLKLLQEDKMITYFSDAKKTVITIENYTLYQHINDAETTQKRRRNDAETTQKHTNKNDKNDKNNNIERGGLSPSTTSFKKPTLEEVRAYCLERKNNVDPQKWYDFYEAKGWMIGKNKMKDWKAAVRTWEQREKQSDLPPKSRYRDMTNYDPSKE